MRCFTLSFSKIRYENRVYNSWRILYKLDGAMAIARCNLCNRNYSVRVYDVISGKSKRCVSCANTNQIKVKKDSLLGDWKVLERYNYKSVKVKCVLCGFEKTMRPYDAYKYSCGCKRGLVYNEITFDKVKDLYEYLVPKFNTSLSYPGFTSYLKNNGIDWIIERFIGYRENINYSEIYEGKIYGNWRIIKYITSENCIAQCLICN